MQPGGIITVTVEADGSAKVAVEGIPGPACKDATRAIEAAIGVTVRDQKTLEHSMQPVGQAGQQVKQ